MIHDAAWLKQNVGDLTAVHEAGLENPWTLQAAPAAYIDSMVQAIVGVEMTVESLEGKWKASQNRPVPDRLGVIDALTNLGTPEAHCMAEIVSRANRGSK